MIKVQPQCGYGTAVDRSTNMHISLTELVGLIRSDTVLSRKVLKFANLCSYICRNMLCVGSDGRGVDVVRMDGIYSRDRVIRQAQMPRLPPSLDDVQLRLHILGYDAIMQHATGHVAQTFQNASRAVSMIRDNVDLLQESALRRFLRGAATFVAAVEELQSGVALDEEESVSDMKGLSVEDRGREGDPRNSDTSSDMASESEKDAVTPEHEGFWAH